MVKKIAVVNKNGVVSGKKVGKAKITAKILNPKLFVRDLRILFFIL